MLVNLKNHLISDFLFHKSDLKGTKPFQNVNINAFVTGLFAPHHPHGLMAMHRTKYQSKNCCAIFEMGTIF